MDLKTMRTVLRTLPPGFHGGNTYGADEEAAVLRVVHAKSPFRYYGPGFLNETGKFESEACKFFGLKYSLAVNSGSGALMLALHALDVGPGDEVVIPGYLWVAVSNAVILRGAVPVLCEVDDTLNMDPKDLERKITKHTKAVIVVHMFGGVANIKAIKKICAAKQVKILEDISQAFGARVDGKYVGTYGDICISSLQLNKMITAGEGGIVLTNSKDYYLRCQARHDMGYVREAGIASKADEFLTIGEGRRMSELQSAVLRVQLKKLPAIRKELIASKSAIKRRIKGEGEVFEFRNLVDPAGDPGSTLTLIFKTKELAVRFATAQQKVFPKGELGLSARENTGLHVYKYVSNLVQKTPVLPDGFPWNHPKNAGLVREYGAGTLPQTDDILARAVGMTVPCGLTPLQADVVGEAISHVISVM